MFRAHFSLLVVDLIYFSYTCLLIQHAVINLCQWIHDEKFQETEYIENNVQYLIMANKTEILFMIICKVMQFRCLQSEK